MRVAVTTVQVPFIRGGAELLAEGVARALARAGHSAEIVSTPFRFAPAQEVSRCMKFWEDEDFEHFDCGPIDAVIALKFPTYWLRHPRKIVWLLHQHRAVYELFDTPYGISSSDAAHVALRTSIIEKDSRYLANAAALFSISRKVSERLRSSIGLRATPLYHPPPMPETFYCGGQMPYVYFPSRLESLKRQDLLIRAMPHVRSPVAAILSGTGGGAEALHRLVDHLGVRDRVRLLGHVDDAEKASWYANSLGVFFGPYDEDYGYVTLEAMLSSKPVITCQDSGGPLEFVVDGETGLVVEPTPDAVAEAIDTLYSNLSRAAAMGSAGRAHYDERGIGWENVVETLLGPSTVGTSVSDRSDHALSRAGPPT